MRVRFGFGLENFETHTHAYILIHTYTQGTYFTQSNRKEVGHSQPVSQCSDAKCSIIKANYFLKQTRSEEEKERQIRSGGKLNVNLRNRTQFI